ADLRVVIVQQRPGVPLGLQQPRYERYLVGAQDRRLLLDVDPRPEGFRIGVTPQQLLVDQGESLGLEMLVQPGDELLLREPLPDLQLGDGAGNVPGELAELFPGQAGPLTGPPQLGSKVLGGWR